MKRVNSCRSTNSAYRAQCGFSSTVEGNSLTFDEEIAKLRLVVETAHDVWG
jgi:5-methyltetrahydropteroyltriglutamate--homocysteine methyltransferase